jgi:hypothetical protein
MEGAAEFPNRENGDSDGPDPDHDHPLRAGGDQRIDQENRWSIFTGVLFVAFFLSERHNKEKQQQTAKEQEKFRLDEQSNLSIVVLVRALCVGGDKGLIAGLLDMARNFVDGLVPADVFPMIGAGPSDLRFQ